MKMITRDDANFGHKNYRKCGHNKTTTATTAAAAATTQQSNKFKLFVSLSSLPHVAK